MQLRSRVTKQDRWRSLSPGSGVGQWPSGPRPGIGKSLQTRDSNSYSSSSLPGPRLMSRPSGHGTWTYAAPDSFSTGYQNRYHRCCSPVQPDQNKIVRCTNCGQFCFCSLGSSRRLANAWAVAKVARRGRLSLGMLPANAAALIGMVDERADCPEIRRKRHLAATASRAALPHL
jgi:hypothetical protein